MIKLILSPHQRRARTVILALLIFMPSLISGKSADKAKVSGIAEVNGTKLYYEMKGKGRSLVLIHGGLVDSRMWDDQFDELAKRYKVIRYDLRGFGKSEFSMGPLSHVEDLYALLKFLKVEKASLMGLSLGGQVATDFTLEHPEMVEKLILPASSLRGYQSPRNEKTIAIYRAAEEEGMEKAIEMWLDHPLFVTGKTNPVYQRRTRQMLAANFRTWGPTPKPIVWTWPEKPTIERLSEIKKPTLIIIGDRDVSNIIGMADVLAEKISGARKVVITNVSHHLNMEKPKEFNKVVLDFLKEK